MNIIFPILLLLICIGMLIIQKPNSNFNSTKKTISVILHYNSVNSYWSNVLRGIKDAQNDIMKHKFGSYNISIRHPDKDTNMEDIPDTMQNLLIQEVLKEPRPVAIICSVIDKKMIRALDIAIERNIPIYIINSGKDLLTDSELPFNSYIASSEENSAKKIATNITENELDNIVIMRSKQINSNMINRYDVLKTQIVSSLVQNDIMPIIKESVIDTSDENKIEDLIRYEINSNSNVKCIVSIDGSITKHITNAIMDRITLKKTDLEYIHLLSYEYPQYNNLFTSIDDSSYTQGYLPITLIHLHTNVNDNLVKKQYFELDTKIVSE